MVKVMMQDDTIRTFDDYDGVATYRGHEVLYFKRLGSYQGDWLMVSTLGDDYFFWRGYYGSCSGCDAIESFKSDNDLDWDDNNSVAQEKADELIYAHIPEFTIKKEEYTEDFVKSFVENSGIDFDYMDDDDPSKEDIIKDILGLR